MSKKHKEHSPILKPGDTVYLLFDWDRICSATVITTSNAWKSNSIDSDVVWGYEELYPDGSIKDVYYKYLNKDDKLGHTERIEGFNPEILNLPDDRMIINQFFSLDEPGVEFHIEDEIYLTLEDARKAAKKLFKSEKAEALEYGEPFPSRMRKTKKNLWREYQSSCYRRRYLSFYRGWNIPKKRVYKV